MKSLNCLFNRTILIFLMFACLEGCGSKTKSSSDPAANELRAEAADLSQAEAENRAKRIENVRYNLAVDLTGKGQEFRGKSKIVFALKKPKQPLRLDFFEGKVLALKINGKTVSTEAKKKYWIDLPGEFLVEGENSVEIDFMSAYSDQGQGLHRSIDPETKEAFLHSHFEPFDANRFMPCFDQPDLKATLLMDVIAPSHWQIISTTREIRVEKTSAKTKRWFFPETPKLSTYLFSLHAGPYKVWTAQFENIPLRIFARPSMAKYVRVNEWFTITKQGLKFFNSYYAYPYPFKKYDQVFAPDFNMGAMENVAAVTFSERFLKRGEITRKQRRDAADTILHEMAHMWFGDIVTMRWWNDLWLNESFATIMASLALAEATEFKEAWQDFFGMKRWAYHEDSMVTTHPIEMEVVSVKVANANFDGISYGKGASVIKQLIKYISPASFQQGIRTYIKNQAFTNAELKDFIAAMQTATDKRLDIWADRWLKQTGTDYLSTKWNCNGDHLSKIEINVTSSVGAKFRPQALEVALFDSAEKKPIVISTVVQEPTTTIEGQWKCPTFIYPNYGDYGYAQVALDPISLKTASTNLSDFNDPHLRMMIWQNFWEMVRFEQITLKDYVALVERHFGKEKNQVLLEQIVDTISGSWGEDGTILQLWADNGPEKIQRDAFVQRLEKDYLARIKSLKRGSDEQRFWFDQLARLAQSPEVLDQFATWIVAKSSIFGVELDVDRRWALLLRMARFGHPSVNSLLGQMKTMDTSDRGIKSALAVESIKPDLENKKKWVAKLKDPQSKFTFWDARSVLRNLFPYEQKAWAKEFSTEYYDFLFKNASSEDENFMEEMARGLSPLNCDQEISKRMSDFIGTNTSRFPPNLAKTLKKDLDEDERCQRIRAALTLRRSAIAQ